MQGHRSQIPVETGGHVMVGGSQSSASEGLWLEGVRGSRLNVSERLGEMSEKLNRPKGIEGKLVHKWVGVSNAKGSEVDEPENLHMGGLEDVSNDGDASEDDNKTVEIDKLAGCVHGFMFSNDWSEGYARLRDRSGQLGALLRMRLKFD